MGFAIQFLLTSTILSLSWNDAAEAARAGDGVEDAAAFLSFEDFQASRDPIEVRPPDYMTVGARLYAEFKTQCQETSPRSAWWKLDNETKILIYFYLEHRLSQAGMNIQAVSREGLEQITQDDLNRYRLSDIQVEDLNRMYDRLATALDWTVRKRAKGRAGRRPSRYFYFFRLVELNNELDRLAGSGLPTTQQGSESMPEMPAITCTDTLAW